MKANELRIGNIISINSFPSEIFTLTAIDDHASRCLVLDKDGYKMSYNNDQILPIPLTDEWMEKFGYTWDNSSLIDEDDEHKCYHVCGLKFYVGRKSSFLCCENEYGFDQWCQDFNLQYVHQFQNLHFALSGKESVIK